jgi:peptide/nickel transport system permease protein
MSDARILGADPVAVVDDAARGPRRRRTGSINLVAGGLLVGVVVATALVSLVYTPYDPSATTGGRLAPPSADHVAGTDRLGRDLLTFLMIGARLAIAVGAGSVLIAGVLGMTVGLVAAFASRWLDDAISSLLDIAIAFPSSEAPRSSPSASRAARWWRASPASSRRGCCPSSTSWPPGPRGPAHGGS